MEMSNASGFYVCAGVLAVFVLFFNDFRKFPASLSKSSTALRITVETN